MKITQEWRLPREREAKSVQPPGVGSAAFSEFVREGQANLRTETLGALFAGIEQQAERVKRTRTFKEFLHFKRLVYQFMKEAVGSGLALRQSRAWRGRDGGKTYTLVEIIDEKLTEMADSFLDKQGQAVDLVAKIGEIKGLLINLYR